MFEDQSFAILSDVHSNICALEACLQDLQDQRAQTGLNYPVFILGDVLDTGPMPKQTLSRVRDISNIHIRGNHEDYLYECLTGLHKERYREPLWRYVPWTLDQIGRAEFLDYYRSLLFSWESPDRRLWLGHASPAKNDFAPKFFDWTTAGVLDELRFEGDCRRVCIVGHTHLSAIYERPNGEIWVNAGSVGYPFLGKTKEERYRPYASYVTGSFDGGSGRLALRIRRVPYDLETLMESYDTAGVLEDCRPYSRAIFAQTVLNTSIVYPAFRVAREQKASVAEYAIHLERYLDDHGVESEIGTILSFRKGSG